jgi:hypothetical protein
MRRSDERMTLLVLIAIALSHNAAVVRFGLLNVC